MERTVLVQERSRRSTRSSSEAPARAGAIDLDRFIPYLLFRISRRLNERMREQMRRERVTIHRWRVLAVLASKDGRRLSELASWAVMEQSVLSRVVDQMIRDSLVRRETADEDRRAVRLFLTQRGRDLFQRLSRVALQHQARATRDMTRPEQKTLVELLQKMLAGINDEEGA